MLCHVACKDGFFLQITKYIEEIATVQIAIYHSRCLHFGDATMQKMLLTCVGFQYNAINFYVWVSKITLVLR